MTKIDKDEDMANKEEIQQLLLEIEQFNLNRERELDKYDYSEPVLEFNNNDNMAILPEFMRKIAKAWPSMKLDLQVYTKYEVFRCCKYTETVLTARPVWVPLMPDPGCRAGNMRIFKMELEKIEYSIPEPAVFRAHVTAAWEACQQLASLRKKVEELESALLRKDNNPCRVRVIRKW